MENPEIANPTVVARPMILPRPPALAVSPSPAPAQSPTLATTPTSPSTGSPAVSLPAMPGATFGPSPAILSPGPPPGGLPAPRLEDVLLEDLKDTARLLDLLAQAVSRGLVSTSEADRLRFVASAEHALSIGQGNPAGLFMHLVRGKSWRYLTQEDEDRANARIKGFQRGPESPRVGSSSMRPASRPALSEDARAVFEFRRAFAAAGYPGDPYPQVRRHDPSWTRERWDLALAELAP